MSFHSTGEYGRHVDVMMLSCAPTDNEYLAIHQKLRENHCEVLELNPSTIGETAELAQSISNADGCRFSINSGGSKWVIDNHTVIWIHKLSILRNISCTGIEAYRKYHSDSSFRRFLTGIPCKWVPGNLQAIELAEQKPKQLGHAVELGFTIPDTIITDDPNLVFDFYRKNNGNIVSKQLTAELIKTLPEFARYTQTVIPSDLLYLQSLPGTPTIFQASIPKAHEIRATVVGNEVFAATIHSQETVRTKDDWRRYSQGKTRYTQCQLPSEIEKKCIALCQRLGLLYGAIDLIVTPSEEYVFLEINPGGRWLWIEELTSLPIGNAILALLDSSE